MFLGMIRFSVYVVFFLTALSREASAVDAPRPNIVVILADDLGYADVGFNGAKDIKTPALDGLAQSGIVFSSAYVAHPVCGPSRTALMTGRWPHTFGTQDNIPKDRPELGIPLSEVFISNVLRDAGYFTGAIGKWHLGEASRFEPNQRGFDEFYGFLGSGHGYIPAVYEAEYEKQRKAGKTDIDTTISPLKRNGNEAKENEYLTDAFSREAVRFIDSTKKDQPFFLYLAYNAPHAPMQAMEKDLKKFAHITDKKRRTYAAMVHAVDRGVNQVVEKLKATGQFENTMIVFLSDNGGKLSHGASNAPLRGGKRDVWEGGTRTPMFIHWPAQILTARRFDHPVTSLDFYPTFARLAGAKIPQGKKLDGKDVWDDVLADRNPHRDEMLFAMSHRNGYTDASGRLNQWKVTRAYQRPWMLFDIEKDKGELRDLSSQHPDKLKELVGQVESWAQTHQKPRWLYDAVQAEQWKSNKLPYFDDTFAITPVERPHQKGDSTRVEFIAAQKKRHKEKGSRFDQAKIERMFDTIDANKDGIATSGEKKTYWDSLRREMLLNAVTPRASGKPNVLFIAIDDLRPELGCYGSQIAVTPHLDALAKGGLLFNRAYCQQAICRPSRASLMTGTRPETTGLFHNYVALRELQPDILTLPQHLIANGYETAYVGKIFHRGDTDDDRSWSRPAAKWLGPDIKKPNGPYRLQENVQLRKKNFEEMFAKYGEAARRGLASGPAFESADVPDHAYVDGYNTLLAIKTMKQMASARKPFFLGMGYHLPHLNWCAPQKYWDLYDPSKIPLIEDGAAPAGGAAMGLHASFELRTRSNIPKYGPIENDLARKLKHAYLASTSYVDAQIGLLLKALDEAGLRQNTIIIVWGDHGWHLGDMGVWGKATNYEIATRVPLMIWTPDMKARGHKTDALVELVDMFPSLCELAGVALPKHLEGHSFVPLLDEPDRPWKKAAFSEYPNPALREWAANPLSQGMRETWFGPLIKDVEQRIIDQQGDQWDRDLFEKHLMGCTMRTDRYRLVVWRDHRDRKAEPVFVELFDHQNDPNETKNIAANHPKLVSQLMKQLRAGWKSAL